MILPMCNYFSSAEAPSELPAFIFMQGSKSFHGTERPQQGVSIQL